MLHCLLWSSTSGHWEEIHVSCNHFHTEPKVSSVFQGKIGPAGPVGPPGQKVNSSNCCSETMEISHFVYMRYTVHRMAFISIRGCMYCREHLPSQYWLARPGSAALQELQDRRESLALQDQWDLKETGYDLHIIQIISVTYHYRVKTCNVICFCIQISYF